MRHARFMVVVMLLLAAASCMTTRGARVPVPAPTESEVLALLPEGAQLANELPILEPATAERGEERLPCVVCADVDGDDENEIVVAYYAAAPFRDPPKTEEEGVAFERWYDTKARVRVLDWDGTKYLTQCDIGCGAWFINYNNKPVPAELQPYFLNVFSVRDITGDAKPEIMFTTSCYLATGTEFSAWSWNGKEHKRIALVGAGIRIEDTDNDGAQEIVVDRRRGEKLDVPVVYEWNGESYKRRQGGSNSNAEQG
jgi:hypothetical protein